MLLLCALVAGSGSVWAQKTFKKISSTSDLVSGCKYLIVSAQYSNASDPVVAASYWTIGEVASNNRKGAEVTISSDCITTTVATTEGASTAHEIQFIKSGDVWNFYDVANAKYLNGGFGKKNGAGSNSNHLKTEASVLTTDGKSRDGNWSISFGEGGVATIQNANEFIIQFNPNLQGSKGSKTFNPILTTYESASYTAVYLYREVVPITPGYAKTTYVAPDKLDFASVTPSGLTAYVATDAAAAGVTMSSVDAVPANTPLVLIGTASTTYYIPVAAGSPAAPATNKLVKGDGTKVFNGSTYDYALGSDGKFHLLNSGTMATTKAYLHLDSAPASHSLDLIFNDGDVTAINVVDVKKEENNVFYNLNGQRVSANHKGLVIVNGKKYMNK